MHGMLLDHSDPLAGHALHQEAGAMARELEDTWVEANALGNSTYG
ncbi:hypothetical protein ACFW2V_24965 [Streptomyces sp. NPDC058947]